ncbi:MAG: LON peptidase substrate-binding domain-containing protein, partial [Ignavibacteriaceae bacterium]
FLSSQKKSNLEDPQQEDIYLEGTIARIVQILKLPNGLMKILVDGLLQGKIIEFTGNKDFFEARIEVIIPKIENDHEMKALVRQMTGLFKEYVKINRNIPSEAINAFEAIEEPDRKLFYAAANINQSLEVKQKILVQTEIKDQFYEVIKLLNSEIDILKIEKEIDGKVQENIGKTQRKFIIQEQIKILQDELGEDEDNNSEISKLRDKIKKAKMPKLANDTAIEELNKLQKIPPMSPEFTVIRNYLDWLIDVPWYKKSEDHLIINMSKPF